MKGPKILFFIAGVLLLLGLFTMKLTTEGLESKFLIAGILLLKGSLYRGFTVLEYHVHTLMGSSPYLTELACSFHYYHY
jgi:predicted membrane protein